MIEIQKLTKPLGVHMKFTILFFLLLVVTGAASATTWPQKMMDLPNVEIVKILQQFESISSEAQVYFPLKSSFRLKRSYAQYAEYFALGKTYLCDQGVNEGVQVQDEFVIMVPMPNTFFNYFQYKACLPTIQD